MAFYLIAQGNIGEASLKKLLALSLILRAMVRAILAADK